MQENATEAVTELLPHDGAECEDWLQLPLVDIENITQTAEIDVNLLQLLLDSEYASQEQVGTSNSAYCRSLADSFYANASIGYLPYEEINFLRLASMANLLLPLGPMG